MAGSKKGKFLRPTPAHPSRRHRHDRSGRLGVAGARGLTGLRRARLALTRTVRCASPSPVPPPIPTFRALHTAPSEEVVADGGTISAIAARWGLATADVLAWNGLEWSSIIHPGDRIALMPPAGEASTAVPDAAPAAAGVPPAPTSSRVVTAGDTLWAIADENGIGLGAPSTNGLERGSIIYPGQTLAIPAAAPAASLELAASTAPATAAGAAPAAAPTPAPPVVLEPSRPRTPASSSRVGRSRGVSDRGIAIALATAMVESWLRNLDGGDRDAGPLPAPQHGVGNGCRGARSLPGFGGVLRRPERPQRHGNAGPARRAQLSR